MDSEWVKIEDFAENLGVDEEIVLHMIETGKVEARDDGENVYIKSVKDEILVPEVIKEITLTDGNKDIISAEFAEKSMATILALHEKVVASKDETITALTSENEFLKDISVSVQEIYEDEKETIESLREQLARANEEIEFLKRKYKLMWNKAIESGS